MDRHIEIFREEAGELLTELESSLLELEERPDDPEQIGCVFRVMHTIKGSGAMAGFDDIAAFTHDMETVFDQVREGKTPVTRELVNLSLSAGDQIKAMIEASAGGEPADPLNTEKIIRAFRDMLTGGKKDKEQKEPQHDAVQTPDTESTYVTYRIRFRPKTDAFSNATNPLLLLNELRLLGDCAVAGHTDSIPPLKAFNSEACYLYWDIILATDKEIDDVKGVFIFVEDDCELRVDVIDEGSTDDEDYKPIGEILLERGDVSSEDLKRALEIQKRVGEILVEKDVIAQGAVYSALLEQQHVKKTRKKRQKAEEVSSIRVSSEKLDKLVNLVGELVTIQARLTQMAAIFQDELDFVAMSEELSDSAFFQNKFDLAGIAEEVDRITGELRNSTMSIRMLPIGTTFNKFKRMVRDLSGELGKEVVMTTEGGKTELDKTVIEQLGDPLVHIIRNAIDHGIEMPEKRKAAEKPVQGVIRVSAEHSGASVLIRISDDGAGLDYKAIFAKAVEKKLVSPDAELSEKEIFSLIFSPGFSTAKKVSGISGRGVGMDVVKSRIEALRGSIEITSKKGLGTTTTLKLPLTLAIIDGLLVSTGEGYFVFPLSAVEECVEQGRKDAATARGSNIISFRGKTVSYLSLRELFNIEGEHPDLEQVVIAGANSQKVGFGVDRVIGQHQTVIKALGRVYRNIEGVSGATILGDGTVALILDVNKLVQSAEYEGRAA
ncbi:MAG: chemotaxis protein CheA [Desulfobacterales bacterium]|nr:chemotaxis protein CheA [Desulfobacterales bacterium]